MKYTLNHGWTKRQVIEQVRKYNNGRRAVELDEVYPNVWEEIPVYRAKDGNRDPIGCFIPTGHSALSYMGTCDGLLEACPDLRKFMPFKEQAALVKLQQYHDVADSAFGGNVWKAVEQFLEREVA